MLALIVSRTSGTAIFIADDSKHTNHKVDYREGSFARSLITCVRLITYLSRHTPTHRQTFNRLINRIIHFTYTIEVSTMWIDILELQKQLEGLQQIHITDGVRCARQIIAIMRTQSERQASGSPNWRISTETFCSLANRPRHKFSSKALASGN